MKPGEFFKTKIDKRLDPKQSPHATVRSYVKITVFIFYIISGAKYEYAFQKRFY